MAMKSEKIRKLVTMAMLAALSGRDHQVLSLIHI